MNNKGQVTSVVLSLALLSGLMPVNAYAADQSVSFAEQNMTAESVQTSNDAASEEEAKETQTEQGSATVTTQSVTSDSTVETQVAVTKGWNQCGTCEWKLDDAGLLTIRPLGNGTSGTLAEWEDWAPWLGTYEAQSADAIKSVKIEKGVSARTCSSMFCYCENLTSVDLSGLDTSNVTDMTCMFSDCLSLTSLDLSGLDTSNVTNMSSMFYGCEKLNALDLSSFSTAKVTDFETMFCECESLTSLDLSTFDLSAIEAADSMFCNCKNLKTIYVGAHFTLKFSYEGTEVFYGCTSLVGGEGTTYSKARTSAKYAHVDGGSENPGYFTLKEKREGVRVTVAKSLTTVYPVSGTSQTVTESADAKGGSCTMVTASDGTLATKYPYVGDVAAFKISCSDGYALRTFNVTYTDTNTGKQVKLTYGHGLTRIGDYNAKGTIYEFAVPNATDISINASWEYVHTSIRKVMTYGETTVKDVSSLHNNTCYMVTSSTGVAASKFPAAGTTVAFRARPDFYWNRGTLAAFNVTYTDRTTGQQVKLNLNHGVTRLGAYSIWGNTYEFVVPDADDITVNITWGDWKGELPEGWGSEWGEGDEIW